MNHRIVRWGRGALPLVMVPLALAGCDATTGGLLSVAPQGMEVRVDGPLSTLGMWRYYDGVRLLECEVRLTARGLSERSTARARWIEAVVDLYDLTDGRYLGSDYFQSYDLADLWGSPVIQAGETQSSRLLRYSSYGPFRVRLSFRYRNEDTGEYDRSETTFDCR